MWRWVVLSALLAAACSRHSEEEPLVEVAPLRAREAVSGRRFARLDPAATGLQFQNELRRENTIAYVYMGAGVAVGDYDADGLPDVYLVSQDGGNKLFRQVAPLRFVDVTETAGLGLDGGDAWGTAASFADVDGDGDLDLYVCNLESPNLLFVNQGDGRFVEKAGMFGLGVSCASTGAAFADYDNDGDLDLYLLANRVLRPTLVQTPELVREMTLPSSIRKSPEELLAVDLRFEYLGREFMAGQPDRLFRNDGYAQFVDVTAEAGIRDHGNGLSVVWWDFDDDGFQDLYVANDFQSPDLLWRNQGDGTFADVTREMLPHTAFFGMGCDFGDIDGDGRMDLCVADMSSTSHYMGKMLMGYMDRHRWFLMHSDPPQMMRNALYVNTGMTRFLEAAHLAGLASTDWTWSVRFADLDEDGRLDFYASNGIPHFADNPDLIDRFQELWRNGQQQAALDVLRNLPRVDERNVARRNVGDLMFEEVGAEWGLDENGVTHGAVVVDLDRDGDLDLITNNLNSPASVFENRTTGTHRLLVELRGADGNTFGVGARIELAAGGRTFVRQVSLTRGYMSAGEAIEHFGLGDAAQVDSLTVTWPSGRVQRVGPVAVDSRVLIREDVRCEIRRARKSVPALASRTDVHAVHVERDFDDFAVQPLLPHRLSRLGPGAAAGDLGGKGDAVWFGGAAGQAGTLLSGYGAEAASEASVVAGPWQQDADCEDMGAVFVDFDGDGDLDLYVASGGVECGDEDALLRDRLYVNDGAGAFTQAAADVVPDLRFSSSCVAAADFDRDGDVDLFVGSRVVPGRFPHAPPSVLLRNEGGRFVDVTAEVAPACRSLGMVSSACWTDVDDDGFVDLVVAAQWQPVRVLGNRAGEALVDRTAELGLAELHGQWNGITSTDIDGDGDFDLVVTNLGLNTKYHANRDKPLQLFASDFDGNGTLDVIEAKRSGDRTLPVRGLSCSSQAMPFVREKFPTFDAFAKANLGEIYGEALAESLSLSCNELRHVVLENVRDRFVVHPLPRRAQISAGFGVLDAGAVPGTALLVAHNFYSPEPETGRIDGGLGVSLQHLGSFAFAVTTGRHPGDNRGLLRFVEASGAIDLVHVRNNAPHLLDRLAAPGGDHVRVRLAGSDGNPAGIGAKVSFRRKGGETVVREVLAGDGYLTQSTAVLTFPRDRGTFEVRWPDGHATAFELDRLPAQNELVTLRP